ncbi:MAG: hypothetical protein ACAI38_21590 [Myxococcota bacterium]
MLRFVFQWVFWLSVGLALAEGALWLRDDGAFPHLNIYVEDAELGVRLRPGATQRVRFGGGPTTRVRINTHGYRGAEWPADLRDAIAVLGDSQVFGLGVDEAETFSARLAGLSGRTVLNAGVPTLGPPEMLRIARELVATQKPRTLILTINLANDLFEIRRPNRERHRVWDGWAVRVETAPETTIPFPGRDILTTKSHFIYAVRQLSYEKKAAKAAPLSLPSEGSWRDLLALETPSADAPATPPPAQAERGNPVDIVAASLIGEAARSPELSAFQLQRALHAPHAHPLSPLDGILGDIVKLCRPPSCEPMLVVLPFDLQVSPDEWRKYELEPHNLDDLQPLTDQLVRSAIAYGIRAVDATPILRASEPGAFLSRSIHLTPKGHAAVAGAIHDALAEPAPLPRSTGALPEGRTRAPTLEKLRGAAAIVIRGAGKSGCEAVQVDEWLRVRCRRGPRNVPRRIAVVTGSSDAFINVASEAMSIVTPVLAGAPLTVDLAWADHTQRLQATRGANGKISAGLTPPKRAVAAALPASSEQEMLCACARLVTPANDCGDLHGSTRPHCFTTYPVKQPELEACQHLLACAQGAPESPPSCPDGYTIAGGTRQCFPQCSEAVPCKLGQCVPWPGTQVCMGHQ